MTTSSLPRGIEVNPYRFDDPTWIGLPETIAARAVAAEPKESKPFWDGLLEGKILLQRCVDCRRYTHTPVGGCQWCGGDLAYEEVDGLATVNTFTPCYLGFAPGVPAPYIVAIVNPICEPRLQIMTNLINCRVADVRIDMPVRPYIFREQSRALLFYQPVTDAAETSSEPSEREEAR